MLAHDDVKKSNRFEIPDPPSEKVTHQEIAAYVQAIGEEHAYSVKARLWDINHTKLNFWLKLALFVFVIAVNVIWDQNVSKILWASGRVNSMFHWSDKILIALVTTSIANFLALVIIVARHLFPGHPKKS
jgi:hypothetical protein